MTTSINQLSGHQPAYPVDDLQDTLQNPIHYLTSPRYPNLFGMQATPFMAHNQLKKACEAASIQR